MSTFQTITAPELASGKPITGRTVGLEWLSLMERLRERDDDLFERASLTASGSSRLALDTTPIPAFALATFNGLNGNAGLRVSQLNRRAELLVQVSRGPVFSGTLPGTTMYFPWEVPFGTTAVPVIAGFRYAFDVADSDYSASLLAPSVAWSNAGKPDGLYLAIPFPKVATDDIIYFEARIFLWEPGP